MNQRRIVPAALLLLALAAALPLGAQTGVATGGGGGSRVLDARSGRWVAWETARSALAEADVVFFGEQHGDSVAHRLERDLLEAMGGRGGEVVLSMEMFERDAQPALDRYLAGAIGEDEFRVIARPWRAYEERYRPLVETAKARGWPVVAANAPQRISGGLAQGGTLEQLDALPPEHRALAAAEIRCPRDAYWERFAAEIRGMAAQHGPARGGGAEGAAGMESRLGAFYLAQCVKDETMAESVARALQARPRAKVLHVNGAFHSDFRQGVVERAARRLPEARLLTVSVVGVPDPARADPAAHRGRADFVVFTRERAEAEAVPGRG